MPQYINRALILVNSILRRTNNQKKIIATQLNIKRSYSVSKNTKIINNTDIIDTPSSASVLTTKIETDSVVIDKWSKDNLIDDLSKEIIFPKALDNCDEDVSHIAPYLAPTFNIAAYANKSPMIQELVKLGVELWKLDSNQEAVKCLLVRDFEDLKPYIQFLTDVGIEAERIGSIITRNPLFFNEDLDNLHTRIRYLRAHKFSRDNIARIVDKNPEWLSKNTTVVDRRLGFFQAQFKLSGEQVRFLVTKQPKLITLPSMKIRENIFAVEGQMGFHEDEVKKVILNKPNILILDREKTVAAFNYAHNVMQLSHEILARLPNIILTRVEILKNRHEFLQELGRVQYDPTKSLYISPDDIVSGSDYVFCTKVAKTSIILYNMFLKSR